MTDAAGHDLTGTWSGFYSYPAQFPPNPFEAVIRDVGGFLAGEVSEPGDTIAPGGVLRAVIEGRRSGSSVRFVKFYDIPGLATPHYRGVLQPGGDEIQGEWTIPGDWSGTFLMVRGARETQVERRKMEAEAG